MTTYRLLTEQYVNAAASSAGAGVTMSWGGTGGGVPGIGVGSGAFMRYKCVAAVHTADPPHAVVWGETPEWTSEPEIALYGDAHPWATSGYSEARIVSYSATIGCSGGPGINASAVKDALAAGCGRDPWWWTFSITTDRIISVHYTVRDPANIGAGVRFEDRPGFNLIHTAAAP